MGIWHQADIKFQLSRSLAQRHNNFASVKVFHYICLVVQKGSADI